MKILNKLFMAIVVLGALVILYMFNSNALLNQFLENYLNHHTTFHITIGDTELRPLDGTIFLKEIKIKNPPQYEESDLVNIDLLKIKMDIASIWRKQLVFKEVALVISQAHAVKRTPGQTNVTEFLSQIKGLLIKKNKHKRKKWIAKRCLVKIDSLSISDYTRDPKFKHEFNVGYSKVFTNLTASDELVEGIVRQFRGEVVDYMLQEFLYATLDEDTYLKMIKKIFSPFRLFFPDDAAEINIPESDQDH